MIEKESLKKFSFFSDVPFEKLTAISKACHRLGYKPGQFIFYQNDSAENLYGVLGGEVELSLIFKDEIFKADIEYEESILKSIEVIENPIVVDTNGPGDIFGWSSLVNPRRMTATARCTKPTSLFSLPAGDLKEILDQDPKLGCLLMERLAEVISQRLQKRTEKLIETWGQTFGLSEI